VPSPFDEVDPWGLAGMKYAQLRRRSPTDAIRDSVQTGTGTQTCPVLGTSHNRLDADHIVPLHTITQMEGFDDLPDADKIAIANLEDNFVGVGKNANSSRQNKSWEAWQRHSRLEFGEGGEAYRQQMIQREAELKQRIADEIATRRAAAEAGC
jgi:hypothetical protein